MKSINNFIFEKLKHKYEIIYYSHRRRKVMSVNDYEKALNILRPDWYEVYLTDDSGKKSPLDLLVEFKGKGSRLYKIMKNNPNNLPSDKIENLKSKYKE